jgi:hypothetical protein
MAEGEHTNARVRQAEVGKLGQVVIGSVEETTGFKPVEAHFRPTRTALLPLTPSPRARAWWGNNESGAGRGGQGGEGLAW